MHKDLTCTLVSQHTDQQEEQLTGTKTPASPASSTVCSISRCATTATKTTATAAKATTTSTTATSTNCRHQKDIQHAADLLPKDQNCMKTR